MEDISGLNTEMVIRRFAEVKDRRERLRVEFEVADSKLQKVEQACEAYLIEKFREEGMDHAKVRGIGTAYRTTKKNASCADWDTFNTWAAKTGNLHMYYKRLTTSSVTEYAKHNDGLLPPAVNVYSEAVIRFKPDTRGAAE